MPKPKRNIKIETPRGQISTYKTKDGRTIARLDWNAGFKPSIERGLMNAQDFVDSECIRRMVPLIPRKDGVLIKSATLGTVIGSGEIHQITPYARRQYYEHRSKGKWFEVMKGRNGKSILEGARKIIANR